MVFLEKLKALFAKEKFKTAKLKDGTDIIYEGETISVDTVLTMNVTDETTQETKQVPVPAGEYELGGDMAGQIVVVDAGGKVTEVKPAAANTGENDNQNPPAAEQQAAEDAAAEEMATVIFNRFTAIEAKLENQIKLNTEQAATIAKLRTDLDATKPENKKF